MTDPNAFDAQLERLRDAYTRGIADVMDRCLAELVLPDHQQALVEDAAKFVLFVLAMKSVEIRGDEPTRANMLRAYWPLEKAIKKNMPAIILEMGRELERERAH